MAPVKSKSTRRWGWLAVVAVAVGLGIYLVGPIVAVLSDFLRAGFFQAPQEARYVGDSRDNLVAIHRALILYADSEGALPPADRWMDVAWIRLQTRDLPKEEAKKKLQTPGAALGEWGYGYNAALAGKHPDDVSDRATKLVFESEDKRWNSSATEPPAKGLAVTVAGEVVGP